MSQERHALIRATLDGFRGEGLITRYEWDDQGARYLIWTHDNDDDVPTVHTMMATEAFIRGVETARSFLTRWRARFVAEATGVVHDAEGVDVGV